MKVHGANRPTIGQVQDKSQVKSSDAAQSTAKSGGERVAVSSLSKLLSQARAPEEAPDAAKVERLRDSIRTGAFKVDHQKVAEAMVKEES